MLQVRDTLKGAEYFEEYIEYRQSKINGWIQYIEEGTGDVDNAISWLAHENQNLLWAMYSAGYPIEEMKPVFSKWLGYEAKSFSTHLGNSTSLYLVPLYSIAALFGMTDKDKENLQYLTDVIPGTDPYVALMAPYLGLTYNRESTKTKWKYFAQASEIEDLDERTEFTGTYLRRWWYNSNKWQAWWGYHKREDDQLLYKGYWAFDIAALVNAWGLDDSSFADFKYYPKDAAHYLAH